MTVPYALEWFNEMLLTAVLTAGPAVAAVVIVGLFMAILQAATQVNDQAIAFGPKALSMILALVVGGPWMMQQLIDFTRGAIVAIATLNP